MMIQVSLKDEISKISWEHTINLDGSWTDGRISGKTEDWVSQVIPLDLVGKKVLDVGAWDGYYSFLCEQRGASVVAIDANPKHRSGFDLAKKILNSSVDYRTMSVYDLDQLEGTFDYVLFLGVIYHLRHPVWALEKIRQKCGSRMFLESSCIISSRSTADFVWNQQKFDLNMCWRFSAKCLQKMCELADFNKPRIVSRRWFFPWRRGRVLMETSV